ncbi:S-adenosyl-L-methionine-dependent methyltransferase [Protomyces lactucae-debilis]|uniref:Ubiquinone biosynthesis O-methyltransferase, mitochondrial n=1 Tax=Protomyces lactucae-debilis TaxID=2754530 RepID=A0A1Y2F7P8_PROLT|nr:S-adenosyl-L-methionine-dependent methyltransferase [Protomyces lactucae-debilis]ORY79922.1 S-adenosyl-L-methionine-dependent methyltransferase [Protomyces lactucae-debilis]
MRSSVCRIAQRTQLSSSFASRPSVRRSLSSASADEISHFDALAATWWDTEGSSALLHKMNPARISFMRRHLLAASDASQQLQASGWLAGKRVLDVGCGGGILTESLARLGGQVLGIDASQRAITVAKEHAARQGIAVEYQQVLAEKLLERVKEGQEKPFQVIAAMEIIEHVEQPARFLETLLGLLEEDGWLFLSTIEKTVFAKLLTCTLAEDILRLVPKGTHNYDKFIPKQALMSWCRQLDVQVVDTRGIIYEPWRGAWTVLEPGQTWGEQCNYIMALRKRA